MAGTIRCFIVTLMLSGIPLWSASPSAATSTWIEGLVVPHQATWFRVPEAKVDLAGFRLSSRTVRLDTLTPEGRRVRQGDPLSSFGFSRKEFSASVEQHIRMVQARMNRDLVGQEARIQDLRSSLAMARQELKKTRLAIEGKKNVLSRRDYQLALLAGRRAAFECDALEQQVDSSSKLLEASRTYHQERLRQARKMRDHLEAYLASFRPLAPHPGRVWHARTGSVGRKPRSGDRLLGGEHYMTLARDDRLAVEFHVPESLLSRASPGKAITLHTLAGKKVAAGTIRSLSRIPRRPKGSQGEKVFPVRAEIQGRPLKLAPGQTVRVKL